ncbi:SDR family oxidoreductase [Pectobacterium carotovorum]|uniref:NAD(P)-dependent oxidoreductase n=1 Tax=Pectobacterium carotovorum subsp. carotovorum TaxID=555 RepID=A0AA40J0T9_PECCC|nr:SDR family oxidoreductase [Pectobacterium carotovorum]KFW98225.1 quinone oxidoreductase [Pectobacterium carotovorum subsp. carotovorum]KHT18656.1 quinone oxidoreductase [Pectobacterium carotovorum subsp. carotovorum]KHT31345.1 quinone oxidoreductase [Pectobacterium carotovorum subsp. carotovorum]KML65607.1 quinone oxidoreductase [Pectobacterium carotovorum subsp. carotovorum ICMP 5702]MBA0177359.1 SDR family oxidoreductase [Pectobacterium carotovorum]
MIAITGASGQLGRLVIKQLLEKVPANDIVALVRDVNKVADLSAKGVQVKAADYNQPEALASALQGVDKVLLISSSEVGQRAVQHRNVIDAAVKAGVKLVAYTSLLHADKSPLALAAEHQQTEALLKASGLPHVLLRNGWYTENYAASIPAALEHGVFIGSAGEGKITSATREDFAAAAVAVLTQEGQAGKVYELAGDEPYTLAELAAEVSKQSGKNIGYQNLSEAEFAAALVSAGLPDVFAQIIADSDTGASKGGLFDDGKQLSRLIGRPTTPLSAVVKATLK